MYGEPSTDPRERFIAQFDWHGADAIYRANRTGPAYRVTTDEYHRFLDGYDRQNRLFNWALLVVWLLVFGVIFVVPSFSTFFSDGWAEKVLPWSLWLPAWALGWSANRWLYFSPARILSERAPVAPALSGDERLDRTVGERSWEMLFCQAIGCGLLVLAMALLFTLSAKRAELIYWLCIAVVGAFMAQALVQMLRKWGLERRQRATDHVASIRI